MTTIAFDPVAFRAVCPAYANTAQYPDAMLQAVWTEATVYISDQSGGCYCGNLTLAQRTLALQYMTAHLLYLNGLIAMGQTPGIETAATIDKVSVTVQPPPETNQWQYWLNTSPYGQKLLALLQVRGVGGFYFRRRY